MAIKIDMEKTFDRMEWNLILAILSKLRFHPTWVNGLESVLPPHHFLFSLMGACLVTFLPSADYVKETIYLHFYLF
jgi:hypothetical protein